MSNLLTKLISLPLIRKPRAAMGVFFITTFIAIEVALLVAILSDLFAFKPYEKSLAASQYSPQSASSRDEQHSPFTSLAGCRCSR